MRGARGGMARAKHDTLRQHYRRSRQFPVKFRHSHGHVRGFNENLYLSKLQALTGFQSRVEYAQTVEERSVSGALVPDPKSVAAQDDVAVMSGNGGMIELEMVRRP